jgi:hypothetical protein
LARKIGDPIESVELTVSIKTSRATAAKIKALIPTAKVRDGTCVVKLVGERPADVAQRAEEMMEKLREVVESPKDFKNAEHSPKMK